MNEELRIIISAEIDKLRADLNKAQNQVKDFSSGSESSFTKFGNAAKTAGKAVGVGMAAAATAVAAGAAALVGLAESTREYRTEQAKLVTAFETAGGSAEVAKKTYNDLYRVLGDTEQATEAANLLAKMTTNEKDLSEWTTICQGAYATFGSSLPIESLAEAANETAKTGEITGALADALNWAGVSEDEFAEQLFWCNTEAEREKLIRTTLNDLYGEAAAGYEENAASILAANEAQAKLTESLAALGAAVEPIITIFKSEFAGTLAALVPHLTTFAEGLQDVINGVAGGAEKMKEGLGGLIDTIITKIAELLPSMLTLGVEIITAILQSLTENFPKIMDAIATAIPLIISALGELIPQITGALLSALPMLVDVVFEAGAQILTTLGEVIPEILEQIVEILPQIITSIINGVPLLLEAAVTFLMAIVQAIPKIIPPLVEALPGLIDEALTVILDCQEEMLNASIELFMALVDAVPLIIPSLVEAIPQIIGSVLEALMRAIPQLLAGSIKMFSALPEALVKIIPTLLKGIRDLVSKIRTELVDKLKSLMNFKWELPKLKVPRFTIKPAGWSVGDLLDGVIPKLGVTWNAKGGVFDKPTVFGYGNSLQGIGEKGTEAVVPLENNLEWLNKLADMLDKRMSGDNKQIVLKVDGKVFAQTAVTSINQLTRQQGKLTLNLV